MTNSVLGCWVSLPIPLHREALKEQNAMWCQGTSVYRGVQIPLVSHRGTRLRYGFYKQTLGSQ